jgi:hypothetical protein
MRPLAGERTRNALDGDAMIGAWMNGNRLAARLYRPLP